MKKTTTLTLLTCLFCAAGTFAQLATKVSSLYNYGTLFTDGTVMYEIKTDSLFSLDAGTGSRTLLYKLPPPPAGNFITKWGVSISVKTPAGFMLDQHLQDIDHGYALTTRVWTNTGSGWDTITVGTKSILFGSPLQLGSKYSLLVLTTGNLQQLLRTDFTKAGTAIAMTSLDGISSGDFRRGTDRIYFSTLGNSTGLNFKEYMMDDASLQIIDSGNTVCRTLGTIGNDAFYERQQVTISSSDQSIRKWSAATSSYSVLVPNIPYSTEFNEGIAFNGHIVVAKTDSGYHGQSLVSIDPVTGTQTYLTSVTNPHTYFPLYFLSNSGAGSDHLFIYGGDTTGIYFNVLTDGLTAAGTQKVASSQLLFTHGARTDPSQSAICSDDAFGKQGILTGNQQLYHLDAAGTVTSQNLNTATGLGSNPDNFVHVGSNIFFTAWGSGSGTSPNYINDLWEITGCSSANGIMSPAPPASAALLYPNPANSEFTISFQKNLTNVTLEIYDALGRKAMASTIQDGQAIPVSSLVNGIYYCRLSSNGNLIGTSRLSILH